jgi:hypothetical protein
MQMIADVFLAAGAFSVAAYCYILSTRMKKFQTLETGMGGAIAVLSAQVDEMTQALEKARVAADRQEKSLEGLTTRGEDVAARLELLLASMHDLPSEGARRPMSGATPIQFTEKRLRFVRRKPEHTNLEAAE